MTKQESSIQAKTAKMETRFLERYLALGGLLLLLLLTLSACALVALSAPLEGSVGHIVGTP